MKFVRAARVALLVAVAVFGSRVRAVEPVEMPTAIPSYVAQQAHYLKETLERESGLEGKVKVTPQEKVIVIEVERELPFAKQEQFKAGMRAMKADMEKEFQRKVSALRFVFLNGEFTL